MLVPGPIPQTAFQTAKAMLQAARIKGAKVLIGPTTIEESTPYVKVQVNIPIDPNGWGSAPISALGLGL